MNLCPLCHFPSEQIIATGFYDCTQCRGIFRSPSAFVSEEKERERYLLHQNREENSGYLQFVSPVIQSVLSECKASDRGLDFGSGPDPAISAVLRKQGYSVTMYDPFFCDEQEALESMYDYIICCEVMEHFHHPEMEFRRLKSLLQPGGKLLCKTAVYHDGIDFARWYYKNDATHVFFYRRETLEWIAIRIGFAQLRIDTDLIVFQLSDVMNRLDENCCD